MAALRKNEAIQMIMVPLVKTKREAFAIARKYVKKIKRYDRGLSHHLLTIRPPGYFKIIKIWNIGKGVIIRYGALTNEIKSKRNPSAAIAAGMKLFGRFHGFDAAKITRVQLNTKIPGELVQIGILKEIVYHSDKDSPGKSKRYLHDFKKPFPVLCTDIKGNRLFILGGGYKVKAEGIVN